MKICEHRIGDFKITRRVNKNFCAASARDQSFICVRNAFEHAHRGCSDRKNTAVFAFRVVDDARGFFGQFEAFFVHFVVGKIFGFNRRESSETDMQRDETNLHVARANLVEQLLREMQTGRWCGDGTGRLREHGLIASPIFSSVRGTAAGDVRWQWDFSKRIQLAQNIFRPAELKPTLTFSTSPAVSPAVFSIVV